AGNEALKRLVRLQCRLVGNTSDQTLIRDLLWAKEQAQRHAGTDVVQALCFLAELCMQSVVLEREADRKQPLVFLYNTLLLFPSHHSDRMMKEAETFRDGTLRALAGDRTDAIWKVCFHAAWCEQNTRDWDGAQAGKLTGAATGYEASMAEDSGILEENACQMDPGFLEELCWLVSTPRSERGPAAVGQHNCRPIGPRCFCI
ncbi:unnamed protein product, partial [Polarella glacialis]